MEDFFLFFFFWIDKTWICSYIDLFSGWMSCLKNQLFCYTGRCSPSLCTMKKTCLRSSSLRPGLQAFKYFQLWIMTYYNQVKFHYFSRFTISFDSYIPSYIQRNSLTLQEDVHSRNSSNSLIFLAPLSDITTPTAQLADWELYVHLCCYTGITQLHNKLPMEVNLKLSLCWVEPPYRMPMEITWLGTWCLPDHIL